MSKKVAVYFDYESIWGMPWKNARYDLGVTTDRILEVLAKHNVKATFFVVGKIVETYPKIIKRIAECGHTIGIHGYEHENLSDYTDLELEAFGARLKNVETLLAKLTGTKPDSFRSPHLMAPSFYTPELYELLAMHGYRYISNREIRYQQELFSPNRLRIKHWLDKNNRLTKLITALLNLRLIFAENISDKNGISKIISNTHWLLNGCRPFRRGEILEVPVYSPLDCDLIGLPQPNEQTDPRFIKYAIKTLLGGLNNDNPIYSLNFHDWIIGTENRIEILDEVLGSISKMPEVSFIQDFEELENFSVNSRKDTRLAGAIS
jgi:hypothetical protein